MREGALEDVLDIAGQGAVIGFRGLLELLLQLGGDADVDVIGFFHLVSSIHEEIYS